MAQQQGAATFELRQRVAISGRKGALPFVEDAAFAAGTRVGVEFDDAVGENNGTVQSNEYFTSPTEIVCLCALRLICLLLNATAKMIELLDSITAKFTDEERA